MVIERTLSEAKGSFGAMRKAVSDGHVVRITRNGKANVMVVSSFEHYRALQVALEVLSDSIVGQQIAASQREMRDGAVLDLHASQSDT